jgi:hypothetical protein
MKWIVTLLIVAGPLLGRAEAQPAPWQAERLTPGWVFTPTVMLGGMWDSNVTVRNQGNPRISELVGTVNPRGEVTFNGRRGRFNAGYSGSLEAYRNVSELNRYEQRGRIATQYRATPRVSTQASASYTATPTTDRLELGGLPFVDIGGRAFDASGGMTFSISPRTQIAGQYRFQHIAFDRDEVLVRNVFLEGGHAHSPLARVKHSLTQRLAVGGEWQYRLATLDGGVQNFNAQTALGEVSYQIARNTSVAGGAGASHLEVSNTDVSMWGPAFRAGIEHQAGRTTVAARYSRSFVPSFSFGGLTGNQEFAVSAALPLTRGGRLQLTGNVAYTKAEPVEELGVGFGLDSLWTNVSLGYMVAPWLRTEGFVSTMHQTSTARGNIDRTRIGIQFVTFKPVRIQ